MLTCRKIPYWSIELVVILFSKIALLFDVRSGITERNPIRRNPSWLKKA